jgi:DNA polymerase-3 subunit delta'
MIRIDAIRELRRDLHMRPFEADRRVYLVFRADLLGEDAADALLKDLEEPPPYAVIVLVADDLGPIPETLRSRCQLVPFSGSASARSASASTPVPELPRPSARRWPGSRRAGSTGSSGARPEVGRAPRAADRAGARRLPRPGVRATRPPPRCCATRATGRTEARDLEEARIAGLELTARDAEQQVKRAARGAEREELLAQIEELAAWYRDLVAVAVGADDAAIHLDKLAAAARGRDARAAPRRRTGGRARAR